MAFRPSFRRVEKFSRAPEAFTARRSSTRRYRRHGARRRSPPTTTPLLGGLFHQSPQLLDGLRVVVDLKPQDYVVVKPDSAVFLDYEHGGRLHAPLITACRLTGLQGGKQSK